MYLLLYVKWSEENIKTKKVVEYFAALARCGKASLVSRYRRKHWANRNQQGRQATTGRSVVTRSTHLLASADKAPAHRPSSVVNSV